MPKKAEEAISIKEYFDSRFTELKNYIDIKFNSMEKSTCLAQENLNTRLESMNEFRATISDNTKNYITRNEHEAMMTKYDADIRILREAMAEAKGKASQSSVYIGYIIAGLGIAIGVVSLLVSGL